MWTQHQSLKSVFLMQLKNHGSSSPHPAQERFIAEWKWWMQSRILCRPLQQIPPTAQNWVELSPLLDQHSYSWECNWDFLEWTCKDWTILFFTTIKSHLSDTCRCDTFFSFLLFIKCLYSWAWNSPWLPKGAERMELKHHQEVIRTASFLPHSPHPLHGMNSLTVLWATSLALLKSNTPLSLFTSLCTLHPRYLTSTS